MAARSHTLAVVTLALLVLATCAQAVDRGPKRRPGAGATVGQVERTVHSAGRAYDLLGDVRAARGQPEGLPAAELQRLGLEATEVLSTVGPFIVYRAARSLRGGPAAPQLAPSGTPTFSVVRNARTGTLGIVLGTIVVQLQPRASAQTVAAAYGLILENALPRSGRAYLRVPDDVDPFEMAQILADDAAVLTAAAEIVEHVAVPH